MALNEIFEIEKVQVYRAALKNVSMHQKRLKIKIFEV